MAATLTVTVLEDGWLVALVRWGAGRGGGGTICHEEERKDFCAGNLEYGISGGRVRKDCFFI